MPRAGDRTVLHRDAQGRDGRRQSPPASTSPSSAPSIRSAPAERFLFQRLEGSSACGASVAPGCGSPEALNACQARFARVVGDGVTELFVGDARDRPSDLRIERHRPRHLRRAELAPPLGGIDRPHAEPEPPRGDPRGAEPREEGLRQERELARPYARRGADDENAPSKAIGRVRSAIRIPTAAAHTWGGTGARFGAKRSSPARASTCMSASGGVHPRAALAGAAARGSGHGRETVAVGVALAHAQPRGAC